jgi:hypothetical protein
MLKRVASDLVVAGTVRAILRKGILGRHAECGRAAAHAREAVLGNVAERTGGAVL